jgi:steroid 5-alpha reductase family enzyme
LAVGPLEVVIVVATGAGAFAWIASLLTGDTSWVDRLWSIVPVIYVWVFAGFAGRSNARLIVMAVLVSVWGLRLTYNFARKGGYSGVEDYRWAVLRASMTKWQFQLFNIFFIVIYQNILLVLITLPALTAYDHPTPIRATDWLLAILFLLCTLGETIADQQQWDFHVWKLSEVSSVRTPSTRFLQTGLFRWSRHPNYFFELAQWWVLFLFGVVASGSVLQWTVVGPVLLVVLFIGSTSFTESISVSKYPEYVQYQATTSSIIPWFSKRTANKPVAKAT